MIIFSCQWSLGQENPILQQQITIEFKQKTLFEIWDQLERAYPVQFFYKEEWVPRKKLDGDYQAVPLSNVLDRLLTESGLGFVAWGEYAILIERTSLLRELQQLDYQSVYFESINPGSKETRKRVNKSRQNVIGDSTIRPLPSSAIITGQIFEANTDFGISNASISVPTQKRGVFADSLGRFSLEVPTGYQTFIVSATGKERREFGLWVYSDDEWEVELGYAAFQLDEVILQAEGESSNINEAQIGLTSISPIQVRRMPSLLGEIGVLRAITTIPGVSTLGEAARGFNVRGGNIDQNLVLQDGNMIFNSSHLLGFFSLFHPDLVKEIKLYKGHIPAQYGGRISSVLDVRLKEGSYRKHRGRVSIGALASNISLDGPIKKGQSSFVFGLRGAYPNIALSFADNFPEVRQSSAYYGDATLKISQKLGELGTLSATGYVSTDYFRFAQNFGYGWQSYMGGLMWKQIYKRAWSSTVQVNSSLYQSSFFDGAGAEGFNIQSGLRQTNMKAYALWPTNNSHTFRFGLQATRYDILDNEIAPFGAESVITSKTVPKDQGIETALFINDEWKINEFFSLNMGLRVSQFFSLGPTDVYTYPAEGQREPFLITDTLRVAAFEQVARFGGLEPRISLKANIDETSSIKLGFNRSYQYTHLLTNSVAATPVDLWQLSNTHFPAQRANSYFFGFNKNFRGNIWKLGLEGYFRDMKGLVVNRDFARLFVNEHIETEIMDAEGMSFGGELSLAYRHKKWDLQLSYAYARSFRRAVGTNNPLLVNGGSWFPADVDMPHNITISGQWKIKKTVTGSLNFVYRSGRPVSAPNGAYRLIPSWTVPAFSDRNAFRAPPFHRLDAAVTFDRESIKRNRVKNEVVFSIYNLYARRNPFSIYFERQGGRYQAYQLAVIGTLLPMISYNFRF